MTIPTNHHKAGARLYITGRVPITEVKEYCRDNGLTAEQETEVVEGWKAARDACAKSLRDIRRERETR